MPISDPYGKEWAWPHYRAAAPARVVDVGAGVGRWLDALREGGPKLYGHPVHVSHPAHWIAVEVWAPNVETYDLASRYDDVIIGDVRNCWPVLASADLVILGDVLEHLPRPDAVALLRRLMDYGTGILVSVPIHGYEQDAIDGNEHERHLWHPSHVEMLNLVLPDHCTTGDVVGVYWRTKRRVTA